MSLEQNVQYIDMDMNHVVDHVAANVNISRLEGHVAAYKIDMEAVYSLRIPFIVLRHFNT